MEPEAHPLRLNGSSKMSGTSLILLVQVRKWMKSPLVEKGTLTSKSFPCNLGLGPDKEGLSFYRSLSFRMK